MPERNSRDRCAADYLERISFPVINIFRLARSLAILFRIRSRGKEVLSLRNTVTSIYVCLIFVGYRVTESLRFRRYFDVKSLHARVGGFAGDKMRSL